MARELNRSMTGTPDPEPAQARASSARPASSRRSSQAPPARPRRDRARQYLHDRASNARLSVEAALHPRLAQILREDPSAKGEAPTEEASQVVRTLQNELRAERKEILEPLLRRLMVVGQRLRRGEPIPTKVIADGIDLWGEYVARLYDVHLGQFTVARSSLPHTSPCLLRYAEIEQEPARADHRIGEVRTLLAGYVGRPSLYRPWLGLALFGDATAELAWAGYEEDFASTCLPDHLTPAALSQWSTALIETRAAAASTRTKVAEYLRRTAVYELPRAPAPAGTATADPALLSG